MKSFKTGYTNLNYNIILLCILFCTFYSRMKTHVINDITQNLVPKKYYLKQNDEILIICFDKKVLNE